MHSDSDSGERMADDKSSEPDEQEVSDPQPSRPASDADADSGSSAEDNPPADPGNGDTSGARYGEAGDGQHYNDRSQLDFDPDDGFYAGTAVTGESDIPEINEAVEAAKREADADGGSADDADGEAEDADGGADGGADAGADGGADGESGGSSDSGGDRAANAEDDAPKPYPHDGKGPDE